MGIRERVKRTLKDLISIPSPSGKEDAIQRYIEERLRSVGIEPVRQQVEGGRFNLIWRSGSEYLISCHVDTVPPINMKRAYIPVEKNGTIRGRGASDVKGALASLLTAVELAGDEPPFSLAFVVDEENNTALGSERILELLKGIRYALVLEPTYGKFCTKQMGSLEFTLKVKGRTAHGAEFEKVENPVKVLFKIVSKVEERTSRPVNLLMVRGGSRHYLVPGECEALAEVKVFEGEAWEEVERGVREALGAVGTSCTVEYRLEDAENFLDFGSDGFARKLMESYRRATGKETSTGVMPSWTDAANYHRAGIRCVVFGEGSLIDSHTERESIREEELERMTLFFLQLFRDLG
ncbi:MAG: M20/M25/M40 family metallo-hydrolase [Aquificota bacterium]|nr:M20/M25/M40 family metallo-hydrolase [Aquificota bacterium]